MIVAITWCGFAGCGLNTAQLDTQDVFPTATDAGLGALGRLLQLLKHRLQLHQVGQGFGIPKLTDHALLQLGNQLQSLSLCNGVFRATIPLLPRVILQGFMQSDVTQHRRQQPLEHVVGVNLLFVLWTPGREAGREAAHERSEQLGNDLHSLFEIHPKQKCSQDAKVVDVLFKYSLRSFCRFGKSIGGC